MAATCVINHQGYGNVLGWETKTMLILGGSDNALGL